MLVAAQRSGCGGKDGRLNAWKALKEDERAFLIGEDVGRFVECRRVPTDSPRSMCDPP